nr:MAG TPA: hypothetical protein [Caudoviricetes sp.]
MLNQDVLFYFARKLKSAIKSKEIERFRLTV